MKKNYLFSLLLGSALLCSCNNDDVLGGDTNLNEGMKDAYLSLSIQLPSGSIKNRAAVAATPKPGEAGDGHELGENTENEIASLLVFGFPQHGQGAAFKEKIAKANLTDLGAVNDVHSYKTENPFKVAAGKYHLYVIVNPSSKMENYDVNGGEDDFKDQEIKISDIDVVNGAETFNHFPMSSAGKIVETEITSAHTKSHPAFFTTQVQRMFAKVVFNANATDNFGTAGNSKAKFAEDLKFVKYGIVNQRNSAYWFRRAGTSKGDAVIGEKETGNNYVIDPIFDIKVSPYDNVFAETHYWNREEASSLGAYWDNVSDKNVKYCFENTMKKEAQLQGYTTGLVLKAHFTPKPELVEGGKKIGPDATFFMYGDKYYETFNDLKRVLPAVESLGDFGSDHDGEAKEAARQELIKKYGDHGVKVFYKGECYYHYWIRHANNGNNSVMGIMEFATVRNNVYKMSVNSVNQPGDPIPPVTPDRPDEDLDVYLDVKVEVLPWVVRENSMDL